MAHNPQSLGFIPVPAPGTPVPLAAVPTNALQFRIQPRKSAAVVNVGNVYIITPGNPQGKGTPTTIYAVLSPEQVEGITLPVFGSSPYDLSQWFVDADNAADAVLVSFVGN